MISSVPGELVQHIKSQMQCEISDFEFAGGGCINNGGRLNTNKGVFFLKWNDLHRYPDMFAVEARGLSLLRQPEAIDIPEVIHSGSTDNLQYLLLAFVEQAPRSKTYWRDLGAGLANLHRNTSPAFGLDHDNYIGSLHQYNEPMRSWLEFFIQQRLEMQIKLAVDGKRINTTFVKKFDLLFGKLPDLFLEEVPALLHGDLWSGNVITNPEGNPCLIDPAVYFGHREVDLAMTQLFGGLDRSFLETYHKTFPLLPGFEERFDIYNLYPLLVHVNLFGGGYKAQVNTIVNRFV